MITFEQLKERMTQAISERVFSRVMNSDDPFAMVNRDMSAIIKEETDKVVAEVQAALNIAEEMANDN